MTCHLTQKSRFRSLEALSLKQTREFPGTNHFKIFESECTDCGQKYLGCRVHIWTAKREDKWTFWAPADQFDRNVAESNSEQIIEMIEKVKHLVGHPDGIVYWNEGPEIALARGAL